MCSFARARKFTLLSVFRGVVSLSRFFGAFLSIPFPPSSVRLLLFVIDVSVGGWLGLGLGSYAGLRAGLVAGLWVGQAYGVFYLPGFGLAVPAPGSLHLRHRL